MTSFKVVFYFCLIETPNWHQVSVIRENPGGSVATSHVTIYSCLYLSCRADKLLPVMIHQGCDRMMTSSGNPIAWVTVEESPAFSMNVRRGPIYIINDPPDNQENRTGYNKWWYRYRGVPADPEALQGPFGRSFEDKTIRSRFVKRVYLILLTQLLFTLGIIALFMFQGVSYGPMWENARSGPELELARFGNARFAPDLGISGLDLGISDPDMDQFLPDIIFPHGGLIVDLSWTHRGPIVDSSWTYRGLTVDLSGIYRGLIGDLSEIYRGLIVDLSGTYRKLILDLLWTYRGLIVESSWIIVE
ncbi:unnamed protein product [Timema podura]|uniref:Uncharacterized protein n=1 Tax=Timema podura TaxID=61482 RepID=A0ABN7NSH5_TIMPD|nr:unnamed protein product [Timema podura]